ncbi:hypothetical protein [Staphylococcus gallinarum]|nr:hypothetical protein [Staphylococcus gallinarum]
MSQLKHNHLYKSSSILTLEVTPVHSGVTSFGSPTDQRLQL